jgi:hypothetical protein
MELKMRVSMIPAMPEVGRPISVLIRPYESTLRENGKCCNWLPVNLVNQQLKIAIRSRERDRITVGLTVDPHLWRGGFVFSSPGRWELTAAVVDVQLQRPASVFVRVRRSTAAA